MKVWKCGIVGAGMIADFHAKAILSQPNAQLCACADNNLAKAQEFSVKYNCNKYGSYEEMLTVERLDIVTIATPSGLHMEPVIAAANAKCHVLCEKPLDISLDRIDRMIEAHKQAGTQLGCVFQNRFVEALEPLRTAISNGRFGKITYAGIYVPWWRNESYYEGSWRGTLKYDGGGALMNQSIHMVDMLCELLPPVVDVQAFTGTLVHKIEAEDTAVAILRFENGALGMIYGTTTSYPGQYKRFEITGSKGTVIYLENSYSVWQFADESPEDDAVRKKFGSLSGGGGVSDPASINFENHSRNFRAFLDALESNQPFPLSGYEGRKAVDLILRIYAAASEAKLIVENQ